MTELDPHHANTNVRNLGAADLRPDPIYGRAFNARLTALLMIPVG